MCKLSTAADPDPVTREGQGWVAGEQLPMEGHQKPSENTVGTSASPRVSLCHGDLVSSGNSSDSPFPICLNWKKKFEDCIDLRHLIGLYQNR